MAGLSIGFEVIPPGGGGVAVRWGAQDVAFIPDYAQARYDDYEQADPFNMATAGSMASRDRRDGDHRRRRLLEVVHLDVAQDVLEGVDPGLVLRLRA